MKEFVVEGCILASLEHKSIIKLYHSFSQSKCFYQLLELCPRGNLVNFLRHQRGGKFSGVLAKQIAAEIVVALSYLRANGIIHRDLKPENVTLDKHYHIKLIDFGSCKVLDNPTLKQKIEAH